MLISGSSRMGVVYIAPMRLIVLAASTLLALMQILRAPSSRSNGTLHRHGITI
jgi:hypothetical protein